MKPKIPSSPPRRHHPKVSTLPHPATLTLPGTVAPAAPASPRLPRLAPASPPPTPPQVLDPEQNSSFVDTYLGLPFDLSAALFVATANRAADIPPPLLDRMEVVALGGYTLAEKVCEQVGGGGAAQHGGECDDCTELCFSRLTVPPPAPLCPCPHMLLLLQVHIAERHLIPRLLGEHGLHPGQLVFPEGERTLGGG